MSLDRSTVEQVARLARLALAPDQTTALQQELNGILELVTRLQNADISAVEPHGTQTSTRGLGRNNAPPCTA